SLINFFVALSPEEQQKRGKEIWTRIGKIDSITLAKRIQYIKNNKTFISIIDLGYLKNQLPKDTVKSIFKKYPEEIRNSKYGNVVRTYLKRDVLEIGDTFYDFEGLNQEKEKVKLSNIRDNEKFTLIDFTSTHCGASMQAVEELSLVYKNYSDSLTIISFSGDPQKEAWLEGVERDGVKWNSIWDGKGRFSETSISYGVTGFPTFVLISPKGEIVDKWTGYGEGDLTARLKPHLY
ncbi:TlpA family protein disulfide reductase, partial [Salinimicrobium sp. CAU 1759]